MQAEPARKYWLPLHKCQKGWKNELGRQKQISKDQNYTYCLVIDLFWIDWARPIANAQQKNNDSDVRHHAISAIFWSFFRSDGARDSKGGKIQKIQEIHEETLCAERF